MTATSNTESSDSRTYSRTSKVKYPYHPLNLCIDVANIVREIGNGRQAVHPSMIAAKLQVSEKSADFKQKISSCKHYGILDGRVELSLTPTSHDYYFPTGPEDSVKKNCLLKFAGSPSAFAELISIYDGSQLVSEDTIGNILFTKFGIPESWRNRVARFFVRSMEFAGAIDSQGFLRYNVALKTSEQGGPDQPANHDTPTELPGPAEQISNPYSQIAPASNKPIVEAEKQPRAEKLSSDSVVWEFGGTLRVETPQDMDDKTWQKLNNYIQVLKPD